MKDKFSVLFHEPLKLGLWIVFALIVLACVFQPAETDRLAVFGWANQVQYYGSYPGSLLDSWTLRGVGQKFVFHAVAMAALAVAHPPGMETLYVFNVIYLVLCLALLASAAAVIAPVLPAWGLNRLDAFLIVAVTVLPASSLAWTQESHLALMLTALAIAFVLSRPVLGLWIACTIMLFVATLKGITVLYAGLVGAAYIVRWGCNRQAIARLLAAAVVSAAALATLYATILRPEWMDLMLAASLQQPTFSIETPIVFFRNLFIASVQQPIIPISLAVALAAAIRRSKQAEFWVALGLIWCTCLAFVVIQNRYFGYHFQPFVLASVASLVVALSQTVKPTDSAHGSAASTPSGRIAVLHKVAVFSAVAYLIVNVFPIIPIKAVAARTIWVETQDLQCRLQQSKKLHETMRAQPDFDPDAPMLYLSAGTANFVIRNPSYLRFIYPLPVQREIINSDLVKSPVNIEMRQQMAKYRGQFVLLQPDWFGINLPSNQELATMLNRDYEVIDSTQTCGPKIELWRRRAIA